MCGSFLWPTTPGLQAHYWFLPQKSQVSMEYSSGVCVQSLWPASLCWASKNGLTCTDEGTNQVAKTGGNGTFQRPSIPGLESKFQNFIPRWLRNKPGQSWTASSAKILMLAWYGVVGQWKVTKWGAIGGFSQSVTKGLTENDISRSKKCQKCSKLAQIEAGFKLHPIKAPTNQKSLFLGL